MFCDFAATSILVCRYVWALVTCFGGSLLDGLLCLIWLNAYCLLFCLLFCLWCFCCRCLFMICLTCLRCLVVFVGFWWFGRWF